MTKQALSKRCVLCLKNVPVLTKEHLLPRSWYPDTAPENSKKPWFPSCPKCNNEYSKLEESLLLRFGLCVDPKDLKASGITNKVFRAIIPNLKTDDKTRTFCDKKRSKLKQDIVDVKSIPVRSILPNFGTKDGITRLNGNLAILVAKKELEDFAEKLVRGITYIEDKSFIEKNHIIEIFFTYDENAKIIIDCIKKFGKNYSFDPGLNFGMAIAKNDNKSALYAIEIWGKLKIYASVTRKKIFSSLFRKISSVFT